MTGITLATVGAGPLLEHCCAVASDNSAGMTTYHIGAAVTYVMRDQHLWNPESTSLQSLLPIESSENCVRF
jgi:hypothetical protein